MRGAHDLMMLTFVHIEDEYNEFEALVSNLAGLIEAFADDQESEPVAVETTEVCTGEGRPPGWVCYELRSPLLDDLVFRYIFVKDAGLPKDVTKLLTGRTLFIIDVLRPSDDGGERLEPSHMTSLEAIRPYVDDPSDVVMFTAHQENGLEEPEGGLPQKISKEKPRELHDFMSRVVGEFLSNE